VIVSRHFSFRCGACGKEYTNRLSRVVLGTGKRRCRSCGKVFLDGCKEWPELGGSKKFEYFFPTTVLGFVAAAIIIPLFAIWIDRDQPQDGFEIGGFIFLAILLPWLPYFLLQWRHIPKSRARFERRRVSRDTEEFIL